MKRRDFLAGLGASAFAAVAARRAPAQSDPATSGQTSAAGEASLAAAPEVAVTLDDFDLSADPPGSLSPDARLEAILGALDDAGALRAAAFVCGKRVDSAEGLGRLQTWNDAGHLLANHTYSHGYYPKADFDEYAADIVRCETLLAPYSNFVKRFRFPYLKEGKTVEQRDRMRAFLRDRGYTSGAVTIDASDWAIDARLRKRLAADPSADVSPYREFFLEHILERAAFYDDLARRVLGRPIRHTLLLHHNLLNALFLGDLLRRLRERAWRLIDAGAAFEDPIFTREPDVAPAGESLVWALAKQAGGFESELRYPAEDEPYEAPRMDELGL